MKWTLFLLLLVASSCKLDADKAIDREKFTFKTGSDTQLFFKNVRQSYYDIEENKAAKFNVFRFSDRQLTGDEPLLNLAIVINYLQDEAYLLLEPSTSLGDLPWSIKVKHATNGQTETIDFTSQNRESTLELVSLLYEKLVAGAEFYVVKEGADVPILVSGKARDAFRITASDYFRLTRIF